MAVLQIPVISSPSFTYDIRLGLVPFRVRLDYSVVRKRWYLSLLSPNTGDPYVSGIVVQPYIPLLDQYKAALPDGFVGDIVAVTLDKVVSDRIMDGGVTYEDITGGAVAITYYDGAGA